MTKSYFIDEQEGSGVLQLKNGRSGRVRWKLEFRSDGLSGHIRGERELLELAAKDTQATISLCHEVHLFAVGPYKQCGTPVSTECQIEPWQTATTHTRGRMFVALELTSQFPDLSPDSARALAKELIARAKDCDEISSWGSPRVK